MKKIIKYFIYTIPVVFLIANSCTLNEPVLPSWITKWAIPVPSVDFEMAELIDDDIIVADTLDGTPVLSVSIKDTVDKRGISDDDIAFETDPETFSNGLSDINVQSPSPANTRPETIQEILTVPLTPGLTIDIPDTNITSLPLGVNFDRFEYVRIKEGTLSLTFINNTFLRIKDSMMVSIYDDSLNAFIGNAYFPPVDSMSSEDVYEPVDLSEQFISDSLRFEFTIPIEAEQNHLITNQDIQGFIQLQAFISDMKVHEAKAELPQQDAVTHHSISVEDQDHKIKYARVKEGKFRIFVDNRLPLNAEVKVTVNNVQDDDGQALAYSFNLMKDDTLTEDINVKDYTILNYEFPGSIVDSLKYKVDILTESSAGYQIITEEDSVIVTVTTDTLGFSMFEGVLDTIDVSFDEIKKEDIVDYNGFESEIRLEKLRMNLKVYNELGIPVELDLDISGQRLDDGGNVLKSDTLNTIHLTLNPGSAGNPAITELTLSSQDPYPNIVDLIAILPTDISISGSAQVFGPGMVTIDDSVWVEYEVSSPFILTFADTIKPYETDIEEVDSLEDDFREAVDENLQDAFLYLDVINGLPVNAGVKIYIATDSLGLFDDSISDSTKKVIIEGLEIAAGEEGPDGFVSSPSQYPLEIYLDQTQIDIFTNPKLYMGTKVFFLDKDKEIRFRSTDVFKSSGYVRFNVLLNE